MYFNIERKRFYNGFRHGWETLYSVSEEPKFIIGNMNTFGSHSRPCEMFRNTVVVQIGEHSYSLYRLRRDELIYLGKERHVSNHKEAYEQYKEFLKQDIVMDWSGK